MVRISVYRIRFRPDFGFVKLLPSVVSEIQKGF